MWACFTIGHHLNSKNKHVKDKKQIHVCFTLRNQYKTVYANVRERFWGIQIFTRCVYDVIKNEAYAD
ncbi:hypothetical protein COI63_35575 [Bacillus toyonensis]|nr:hypothetical protein COL55_13760 [Bacillus toyonensis]PFY54603.1 hypothetical protein COL62_34275 [Bacillus toyonensis]PHA29052.1 hypothetical protein COE68_32645 [Bacillus toyonensis]PHF81448.1 hypothetical protein COI63_35575 [Bacillus toyonensis]